MPIDSTEQTVIDILNGFTGLHPGEIDPDLSLSDEGLLDSFATIQLLLASEEGFGLHPDVSESSRA